MSDAPIPSDAVSTSQTNNLSRLPQTIIRAHVAEIEVASAKLQKTALQLDELAGLVRTHFARQAAVIESLRSDVARLEGEKVRQRTHFRIAAGFAVVSLIAFFVALAAVKVNGLSGGHVVEIVALMVIGVLLFCGFAFGRFVQANAELGLTKMKLQFQVGKDTSTTTSDSNAAIIARDSR
jgi:hypothetical protein